MIDVHGHASVPIAARLAALRPDFVTQRDAMSARYKDPATAAYMAKIAPKWEQLLSDTGARLAMMDEIGIETQFVSVNPGQYYYWAEPSLAQELVEIINQELCRLANTNPGRIVPIGTVALQHPSLAAQQLTRAVVQLAMAGVQISSHAGNRDLSDPVFEDLWSAAEECDAVVMLHPLGTPELVQRLAPSYLNNIVGQPFETTLAISHLIFGGVLDRHPGLRICAVHGGGYFPHYLGRPDHAWLERPDSHSMQRAPSEYLSQFWFDSLVHSADVLLRLISIASAKRVVIGSDFPFDMGDMRPDLAITQLSALPTDDLEKVVRGNALELLGSHASLADVGTGGTTLWKGRTS